MGVVEFDRERTLGECQLSHEQARGFRKRNYHGGVKCHISRHCSGCWVFARVRGGREGAEKLEGGGGWQHILRFMEPAETRHTTLSTQAAMD